MVRKIKIGQAEFEIIDAKEKMTVPDCWVLHNKIGSAHGEAKFYIGNESNELFNFFDDFSRKCIILKSDLIKYLNDVKSEYKNPQQLYKNKIKLSSDWGAYLTEINNFESDVFEFYISRQNQILPPRVYIKSNNFIYTFLRKISLPYITYLSALKLKSFDGEIIYYWRLFVDYFGNEISQSVIINEETKINNNSDLSRCDKTILVQARIGQGKYRENLLNECPFCPITLVSDDRLLIASHIKPWAKSEIHEKIDSKNGFMLTPTYDFLFDRGFITFSDNKEMMVSNWLSKMTCSKLNLFNKKTFSLLPVKGREKYLDYHRNKIFKG
jgi:putative restriction endonuclease